MKRNRILVNSLIAALVLGVAPMAQVAVASSSSGGGQQFAQGSGIVNPGNVRFQFVAHSGPSGEDARGHISVSDQNGFRIVSEVTCLKVVGNRATIGGQVTESNVPNQPVGSGSLLYVEDNDAAGRGHGTNLIDGVGALPTGPAACPPPTQPTRPFDGPIHVSR